MPVQVGTLALWLGNFYKHLQCTGIGLLQHKGTKRHYLKANCHLKGGRLEASWRQGTMGGKWCQDTKEARMNILFRIRDGKDIKSSPEVPTTTYLKLQRMQSDLGGLRTTQKVVYTGVK